MSKGLVIIGGSYAGLNLAAAAREAGYGEPIRMVTEERWRPYHRPPLSKGFLLGKVDPETLPLRAEAFYSDHGIEVITETRAEVIDLGAMRIETDGGRLDFDHVAVATGTRARLLPLPGADLDGVVTLRTLDDAEAMRARVGDVGSVVIIGGGFIGLELAASLKLLGKSVTVLEGLERVLARVTVPALSAFIADAHRARDVNIVCNASVVAIEGGNGRVTAVRTGEGERLTAEMVIIAVGAVVNSELLEPLGLANAHGIEVDGYGRTADARVLAAGDCAYHWNVHAGDKIRLESVQNATDQAKVAGACLAGRSLEYNAVPWFWSDQFDIKLQMVGFSRGADTHVVRGAPDAGKFSILHLRKGVLIGIDSINAPADHMTGRRLLPKRPRITAAQAADTAFDLKSAIPD